MQRIQDPTAVTSLPAPPTLTGQPVGFFQGSIAGGIVTRIRYWWLNMIQEELIGLLVAAGLPIDGSATVLQAVKVLPPGRLLNRRVITSSTIYTPTAGTKSVFVQLVGGGASGGSAQQTGNNQISAGPGGGAGGYCEKFITSGFSGVQITIGLGGVAPSANANGNPGGSTSFGSILTATGGIAPNIGLAGTATGLPNGGAAGGAGYGGDLNAVGGYAIYAFYTNPATSSSGGRSFFGDGGGGVTGSGNGGAANSPGAGGGGGAQSVPNAGSALGGAGAAGIAIVWEFS